MTDLTPPAASEPSPISVERFFSLLQQGVLAEDDRVELLGGVIVSMTPSSPRHAATVGSVAAALQRTIREHTAVRIQSPLVLGRWSAPEPDVAVVAGSHRDYVDDHPHTALLVVEVSDSSLQADRLTKAAIFAAADVPEYWIVNLREDVLEVHRMPEPARSRYHERFVRRPGERISPLVGSDRAIAVAELLPGREREPATT